MRHGICIILTSHRWLPWRMRSGRQRLTRLLERIHQAACPLAGIYHDLLIKEFTWQSEPLQYKGGPVAIIPKCLSPTVAKQFRGILLLGNMAKRTHSVLRQRIMTHLERARAPGQLGGFQGQQVMFGSQALRLFGQLAAAKGVSSAVLFLDLSNAFHHLVRSILKLFWALCCPQGIQGIRYKLPVNYRGCWQSWVYRQGLSN